MYNLNNYPDILSFLKHQSSIFKNQANGWIQIFCPYCNDATRKSYVTHGHFYISKTFNYCQCFRCEHASSFTKFLKDTGFEDNELIKALSADKATGNYVFAKTKSRGVRISDIYSHIISIYESSDINYLKQFLKYVYIRCLDINPIDFLLFPNIVEGNLTCGFYNYNGIHVSSRYINNFDSRYIKNPTTDYYFFQDINTISEYSNIIICEGGFDLINLYNYSPLFNNKQSFYIAINGRDYKKIIKELILNYLLLGQYTFNIVFDKGIKNIEKIKKFNKLTSQQLNTNVNFQYFEPTISKDVSEIMSLTQI